MEVAKLVTKGSSDKFWCRNSVKKRFFETVKSPDFSEYTFLSHSYL